ncbi:BglII/BstYI family type II restriction endonuclease [Candidatus Poriferisocius sp.]|uniref:BglII/BstYI family type II restriction endonuclease n=1 Tax=Candidatus Poriferisocius sp. TaxID=3101276 RepID=UPI003B01556A
MEQDDEAVPEVDDVVDLAGQVRDITVSGLPEGYDYKATRYADVILKEIFPNRFRDLAGALDEFEPTLQELQSGGGGKTHFVQRFDKSLAERLEEGNPVWGKQNITIEKGIEFDGNLTPVSKVRGHEIDMFGVGSLKNPLPGIAVEMEWNNKNPFFDRDLINFQALHHEGVIAVGAIVTRSADLQDLISKVIINSNNESKYGATTTHWGKLIPRINLGGGGECPLLLIGIRPERIKGIELAYEVKGKLEEAEAVVDNWRNNYSSRDEARPFRDKLRREALALLPPIPRRQSKGHS